MPHWSVTDEPTEPASMVDAEPPPAAEPTPPPLAPVERVAEILERFFLEDARLTAELLGELSRCSVEDLAKLFGVPSRAASPTYGPPPASISAAAADVSTVDTPAAEVPPAAAQANLSEPRWDHTGRRLNPGRRAFNYPLPQVRGSHWSG